jgi:hypothetical protein
VNLKEEYFKIFDEKSNQLSTMLEVNKDKIKELNTKIMAK